jgi:hypothetical protein
VPGEAEASRRCFGRDSGELEETVGGFDLAVFDIEALKLQQPSELLEPPHFVPVDDLPSGRGISDVMGGEHAPVHRIGLSGRIALDHLDERLDLPRFGGRVRAWDQGV